MLTAWAGCGSQAQSVHVQLVLIPDIVCMTLRTRPFSSRFNIENWEWAGDEATVRASLLSRNHSTKSVLGSLVCIQFKVRNSQVNFRSRCRKSGYSLRLRYLYTVPAPNFQTESVLGSGNYIQFRVQISKLILGPIADSPAIVPIRSSAWRTAFI